MPCHSLLFPCGAHWRFALPVLIFALPSSAHASRNNDELSRCIPPPFPAPPLPCDKTRSFASPCLRITSLSLALPSDSAAPPRLAQPFPCQSMHSYSIPKHCDASLGNAIPLLWCAAHSRRTAHRCSSLLFLCRASPIYAMLCLSFALDCSAMPFFAVAFPSHAVPFLSNAKQILGIYPRAMRQMIHWYASSSVLK